MLHLVYNVIEPFFTIVGGAAGVWAIVIGIKSRFFRKITWRTAFGVARALLEQIEQSPWKPDIVVGIGRGGALWAGWLAGNLGSLPIAVIDREYVTDTIAREPRYVGIEEITAMLRRHYPGVRRVLAVMGSASSGQTMLKFNEAIRKEWPECDLKNAALYASKGVPVNIQFVGARDFEPWPKEFPWHDRPAWRRFLTAGT